MEMTETVKILEEEDGDARQVETVETLEDGNRDEEQDIKVVLELERRRWAELIARNTWCSILPIGRVCFLGFYQRKIIAMLCMRHKCTAKYNHSTVWSETPTICLCKDSIRRHSF